MNNFLTLLNISVALFVIVCGMILADSANWAHFLPNGASSIFEGAAQAYYAFVGYDVITIASEEALTPEFSVPFALAFVVFFVTFLYCSVSVALTLMVPFQLISNDSAFASALDYNGWTWAKNIASAGAIAAMSCTLLGCMITMPRALYAMASDGIIFQSLSKISSDTRVPVVATILGTIKMCLFAFFLELRQLAEFLSIGTLLAYLLIALAVIMLRYHSTDLITGKSFPVSETVPLEGQRRLQLRQLFVLMIFVIIALFTSLCINFAQLTNNDSVYYTCLIFIWIFCCCMIYLLCYLSWISTDNKDYVKSACRVPLVPFLPGVSVFVNIYLMTQLKLETWMRFIIWMALGFLIYFGYGIQNSRLAGDDSENGDKEGIISTKDHDIDSSGKKTSYQ